MRLRYTLFLILLSLSLTAQVETLRTVTIEGNVKDAFNDQPIEFATVYIQGTSNAVETDPKGNYSIEGPTGQGFTLVFTRIGYKEATANLPAMKAGTVRRINVSLASTTSGLEVIVTESRIEDQGMVREEMTELKLLPTTTGNLESVLPAIALGTSSGTGGELSSQYNVRGGNYDENLVYVNDFEIYRPQLIRAGQQEGLTFANIDLIRDLTFSSGGFQAKFGDKLSSVLDIRYKRPDSLAASV
ncbi:MAG: carboxypeptidase-like regulatory domain-containing protein, partial [Bacteroidota bacterium]